MNLEEQFCQVMTRLKANSRAASTQDARVTEIINGLLVSKPVTIKKEPEIIYLQEYAKSTASAPDFDKLKAIQDFIIQMGESEKEFIYY